MEILLSIKPEYSKKIITGSKRYEFRKQVPKSKIERVFIYESNPSKSIVGWFSVKRILSGSPEEIWKRCKEFGGIEKEKYLIYCKDKTIIYALEIDKIFRFDIPINPFESLSDFKPPQNFTYFNNSIVHKMLEDKGALIDLHSDNMPPPLAENGMI